MTLRAILFPALAAVLTAGASPQIKWLQTEHDFGAFNEDLAEVGCSFRMVNTGDEPVVINNARATCGCTTPKYPTAPIAPGDTAEIQVSYNAIGRPGKFSKKIYIYSNTTPERTTLTISGTVIGASNTVQSRFPVDAGRLKLRNSTVAFGDVTRGKIKSQFLEAYNQSSDTLHPVLSNVPDYIQTAIAPEAVAPGEQVTFTLFLNSSKVPEWGINMADMTMHADRSETTGTTIQSIAIISEDFSHLTEAERRRSPMSKVSPAKIDLGRTGIRTPAEAIIEIGNDGKDPLEIRRVYTIDKGVTATVDRHSVKHGQSATVRVKADPSAITGDMINARINIITNDPITPLTTVRVVGEISR
jgi:hypothetical protein